MLRTVFTCLAVVLFFVGCQFDSTVPPSTRVTCATDADCLSGRVCEPRLKVCLPKGESGPVLTATLDTAWARAGTVVHLSLTSDTPLLSPPLVGAVVGPDLDELTVTETADGWVSTLTVTPDLPEGPVRFVAQAYGAGGLPVQNPNLTPVVIIDLTPPRLDLTASSVSPAFAISNTVVAVRAVFTEPVVDGATLAVSGAGSSASLPQDSNQNGTLAFSYRITPGSPDGALTVAVVGVQDRAGNPLEGPTALPGFTVDNVAPTLSAPGVQGQRYSSHPGHSLLSVPVHVDDPLAEVTVWFGTRSATAHDGDVVPFTITDTDAEGVTSVVLTAHDLAGNAASGLFESVVVDHTPPDVFGAPLLQFTLPQGCPLSQTTALGVGMSAAVLFNTDEALGPSPQVSAGPLNFTLSSGGAQAWRFGASVTAQATSGTYALSALLEDDVGNAATRTLSSLVVATAPPAPLSAQQLDGVVYQRAPWGADSTGNVPHYSVSAATGTLPAGHALVFWSSATPVNAVMLGRATALADGSFASASLIDVDHTQIFAQHFDGACNVEGPAATLVRTVETLATLQGKVPGLTTPNPHQFEARAVNLDAGLQVEADPSAVATVGGAATSSRASGLWQVLLEQVVPSNVSNSLIYDGDRSLAVLHGINGYPNYTFDGVQWRREGTGPPAAGGVAVWDPVRHLTVLVAGGHTWESDGGAWVDRGPGPTISGSNLLYAADRQLIYGFGTAISQYDGTSWVQLSGTGADPTRTLGYHQASSKLLLMGGKVLNITSPAVVEWVDGGFVTAPALNLARYGAVSAYDPVRQRLVITGGMTSAVVMASGAEEFDGTTWTSSGAAAYATDLVWDPALGGMVALNLVGTALGQIVAPRDGGMTVWTPTVPRIPPVNGTIALSDDQARGISVLITSGGVPWELTDAGWSTPAVAPLIATHTSGTLGYDPSSRQLIYFGGGYSDGGVFTAWAMYNDTWAYDGGGFSQVLTATTPPARALATAVTDTARGRLRLFGGCVMANGLSGFAGACTTTMSDAWEFTGSDWQSVASTNTPLIGGNGPGVPTPIAFDSARAVLTLVQRDGGTVEFSQGVWNPNVDAGTLWASSLFYDEALGELVAIASPTGAFYDGVRWVPQPGPTPPGLATYQHTHSRGVAVDGTKTWARALSPDLGPAHLLGVSCANVVPAGAALTSAAPSFVSGGQSTGGSGATVGVWSAGRWLALASNAAPPAAPAAVSAQVTDAATLAQLCDGGVMGFEVTTLGGSDYALDGGQWQGRRAVLTTDYAEVRVRARWP